MCTISETRLSHLADDLRDAVEDWKSRNQGKDGKEDELISALMANEVGLRSLSDILKKRGCKIPGKTQREKRPR